MTCCGGWPMFAWTLFLLVAIVGVVLLFRGVRSRDRGSDERETRPSDVAVRILEERFARGEIDREELESRRDALRTEL